MNSWGSVFLLSFLISITAAATQPLAASLSLNEVLSSLEQHYPLVRASLQDLEKSRADLLSAQGGFDPVLRSSYQNTPSGEYVNSALDASV